MQDEKLITDLVADIVGAEPALRGQEDALRRAVTRLLESKPETPRDEAFYATLRSDLMRQFSTVPARSSVADFFTRPWFLLPAGAVAVIAIAVAANRPALPTQDGGELATGLTGSGVRVTRLAAGAFGSLATSSGADAAATSARPQSGGGMGLGGGGSGVPAMAPIATEGAKIAASDAAVSMIAPMPYEPVIFNYRYDGEPLQLQENEVQVLRRIKGGNAPAGSALSGLLPSFLDAARLSDLRVQSFSAYEDKPFGMSVYADLAEESVSMSQNYNRWPHPEAACRDQACYESMRIKESDLPSDEEAIALADRFMAEYGISRAAYGQPTVRSDWRRWYDAMPAADRLAYWFPEIVQVVYPMLVNDVRVVDESGYAMGPTVNVNARAKRADGLWNLSSANYESSGYAAETDAASILAIAARGGVNAWVPEAGTAFKTVELSLGTPEQVYVRTWQHADGVSKELLVPALRFPVSGSGSPETGLPPESVVIPLAKELLVRPDGGYGGPITIMGGGVARPAVEPAVNATTTVVAPSEPSAPVPDAAR